MQPHPHPRTFTSGIGEPRARIIDIVYPFHYARHKTPHHNVSPQPRRHSRSTRAWASSCAAALASLRRTGVIEGRYEVADCILSMLQSLLTHGSPHASQQRLVPHIRIYPSCVTLNLLRGGLKPGSMLGNLLQVRVQSKDRGFMTDA